MVWFRSSRHGQRQQFLLQDHQALSLCMLLYCGPGPPLWHWAAACSTSKDYSLYVGAILVILLDEHRSCCAVAWAAEKGGLYSSLLLPKLINAMELVEIR